MVFTANGDASEAAESPQRCPPDAQGQAALLLVESLLHTLVAKSTLSLAEAVEVIDVAAEVDTAMSQDRGAHPEVVAASLAMLDTMASSLRRDLDR